MPRFLLGRAAGAPAPPRPRPPPAPWPDGIAAAAAGSSEFVGAVATASPAVSATEPSLENAATGLPAESAMSMRIPVAGTLDRKYSITPPDGDACGATGSGPAFPRP